MSKINSCALVACILLTGSALASPTVTVTQMTGYYYGTGGEFTVTPNADLAPWLASSGSFQSFCMEFAEEITPDSTYAAVVNTEAVQGGLNNGPAGPGGGDPIDARTAYLYSQFTAGTLAGYDYTPSTGRIFSARALQDVIWYLEDEQAQTWSAGSLQDTFYTAAQNAVDSGSWTGLGNVRVLNLYEAGHAGDLQYRHQDLLATASTVGPVVPAPGALLLVSLGTGLVGWLRRRQTL